jgi:hypothetical protein
MHSVYASVYPELEIEMEATWFPSEKDSWDCPGHGAFTEGEEVTGIYYPKRGKDGKDMRVDLLAGVNRQDPMVQLLLSNILEAVRDQAEEALAMAGDDDD